MGLRYFRQSRANNPPNPPTLPRTPGRWVRANKRGRVAFTLLPKSMSTPALAYAFSFIGESLSSEKRLSNFKAKQRLGNTGVLAGHRFVAILTLLWDRFAER